MSQMQQLLDKEATTSDTIELSMVRESIRGLRESLETPVCFGTDDCSTQALSVCPFRFDCGEEQKPYV